MIIATIIGMAIVTMVPRFIPAFIMEKVQLRPWLNRWLNAIPFAALGALIFPSILTVIPDQPWIGLAGGLIAVVIALFNVNVIFAVLGAIATVFLLTF
ncbi:AzlD domain-containing protein [Alkalibacillus sp. S2W]|uniref:AzlD domain-containing protein n=1 Tax=Alkalibacillus TaxID=331654 RepID=UPI00141F4AD5|nr:AzlD domain-containing protein [Alkalibacillus almallahensis]NIK12678.1 branched-subunit amino acid transport protein [Alkalibacillus almallahensis]